MKKILGKLLYPSIFTIFLATTLVATYYSVSFFRRNISDVFVIDESKINISKSIDFSKIRLLSDKLDLDIPEQ